jgi:hypothetical protein
MVTICLVIFTSINGVRSRIVAIPYLRYELTRDSVKTGKSTARGRSFSTLKINHRDTARPAAASKALNFFAVFVVNPKK